MHIRRFQLSVAVLSPLGLFLGAPGAVLAQSGAADDPFEEIVVTAQRREQALQDVPMAISAFSSDDLAALQADNLDSIQGAVPNLNIARGRGSNSSVNVFIRGVGQPDALQTFDPAVGVYLDDVFMTRIQGALFKLFDVERIEVLRGPQGTLYGKNTPGGAIRLITKSPGDEFEIAAGLLVGDYERVQAKGYIAGPLTDSLSLGVSALVDKRDGFVDDPLSNQKYNDEDTAVGRVKLHWDASDNLEFELAVDSSREDVALSMGRPQAELTSIDFLAGVVERMPAPTGDWGFASTSSFTNGEGQVVDNSGAHLTMNWDVSDNVRLRSITAYRELDADLYIDIDATELELGDVLVAIDKDQFSQEFQLLGNNGGRLNWVAGLYYLDEDMPSHQEAYADDFLLFGGFPVDFLRTIDDRLRTKSYAVFGQVDIALSDAWNLGLGVRYTDEEKEYDRTTSTFSAVLGNADPAFAFTAKESWDDVTPTVTLDYALSDDIRFYGRVANGFKSGGFNGRANSAADVSTYDPETVWTAEFGAKTVVADGKLRANYAIFTSKYDDFQARVSEGDGVDFRFPVLNAAEMDISGAEFEALWFPSDAWQFAAQVGYLDTSYGGAGFTGADGLADEPAFAPEWTGRFAGTYTASLQSGATLGFTVDTNYRDAMELSVENVDVLTEDSYWLVNGLVKYTSASNRWSIFAGIKNATDEEYRVEGQDFRSVGNILTAYYGDPRTWTLGVEFRNN